MSDELRQKLEDALIREYYKPLLVRNPAWAWDLPDGPNNEYYLPDTTPREEKLQTSLMTFDWSPADNTTFMRSAMIFEIINVVLEVLDE